jgi:hypothetical protein
MKNLVLLILATLVIGLSVVAWVQQGELNELRSRQAVVMDSGADLKKSLAASQDNVRELERQLQEARKPVLVGKPVLPAGSQPDRSQTTEATLAGMMPTLAAFMDRPEMQRMMAFQQKSAIDRRFAGLFKQMNLSPEQQERFKALLLERELSATDAMLVAAKNGFNVMQNPEQIQKLAVASQSESEAQIKELLGDAAYAQYQDYRRTEPQRSTVAQLQQNLGYTDTPLTLTQSTQLTRILAETNPGKSQPGTFISEEAIARATPVLSQPQVEALQELRKQQQAAAEMRRAMLPLIGNAGKGN